MRLVTTVIGVVILLVGGFWLLRVATEETEVADDVVLAEGIDRVTVQVEAGRIESVTEERSDVAITTDRVSSALSDTRVSVEVIDGTLAATGECEPTFFVSNCSVNYTIAVPQEMITQLDITTTAGQIEIRGSSAEANAQTTAGGVGITVPGVGYQVSTNTTVGGINESISQDPESGRSTSVETTAGGIGISGG